jgi:hypothetical protein
MNPVAQPPAAVPQNRQSKASLRCSRPDISALSSTPSISARITKLVTQDDSGDEVRQRITSSSPSLSRYVIVITASAFLNAENTKLQAGTREM